MADKQDKEELESFLNKVDEIESIIKGMSADDTSTQSSAFEKADSYLKQHNEQHNETDRTVINTSSDNEAKPQTDRTVINTSSDNEAKPQNVTTGFMQTLEEDANRRAEENKRRKAKADKLKEKGNAFFKSQKYEEAIKLYTEALQEYKLNTAIYTNRAQALVKVEKYEEAINDCETALKVDEYWVKAYVHKGRALQYLKDYDKSIDTFQEAIKLLPKQEKVLKGYLQEVEADRSKMLAEEEAAKVSNQQATDIKTSIQTLLQPGHDTKDYRDAAKMLVGILPLSETNKILFRTSSGFDIVNKPDTIITRFWEGSTVCKTEEEIDCFTTVIKVLQEAITNNDHNVQTFLVTDHSKAYTCLLHQPTPSTITKSVIELLRQLTQTSSGRLGLISSYRHTQQILEALLVIVNTGSPNAVAAMATISDLAYELKFGEQFSEILGRDFLKISKNMLARLSKVCSKGIDISVSWSVTRSLLSTMLNMARSKVCRELIARSMDWWDACRRFMDRYARTSVINKDYEARHTVVKLLGLLTNVSSEPNHITEGSCEWLMTSVKDLLDCWDDDVIENCVSLLRFLLTHSKVSLDIALSDELYLHFIPSMLKVSRPVTVKYSVKCLALCTSGSEKARQAVYENKGVDALVSLLSSDDEIVIGNAALCLGDCALNGEVCKDLVNTDIVQVLLTHATNDALQHDVKRNAVLCLARLATGHERHREVLRSLHGLEILHSVYSKS